ncbi:MAG: DeoR/GlpR family DNA-binding transcription regulator [Roseiarcus sp.]
MNALTERQHNILLLAKTSGVVQVEALAEHFGVTPQTIRSDLNELCDQRLLKRSRGGAVVVSSVENLRYEARRLIAADQKRAIGEAAAKLIPDNSSLFINIGTTTEEVARCLVGHKDLLVITNNLNVAVRLHTIPEIDVILAGGPVRRSDGAVTGAAAIDLIRQFKVDNAVIGCSALDEDGALLDFDYQEVRVSQTIIENARRVILVCDRLKLERVAPIRIGHMQQVHVFVTDRLENPNLAKVCAQAGVQVIEAEPGTE